MRIDVNSQGEKISLSISSLDSILELDLQQFSNDLEKEIVRLAMIELTRETPAPKRSQPRLKLVV